MIFGLAQSSVAKYMVKRRGPPSQGWLTFLRNHAPDIAAMDLFVVPTIGYDLLYAFVVVRLDRRDLVSINVTRNPTAEWVARQITEAFPWDGAPRYMIRDRDRIYGTIVTRRLCAMGIRDKPIAPASPWQNGFAERLIGSMRRECLDAPRAGDFDSVIPEMRHRQRRQKLPSVGAWVGSHAAPARWRQRCEFLPEFAIFIEQILRAIAPHPLFELLEVLGILEVSNRHLMGAPRTLDSLAVYELGARPALWGLEHDHRPARTLWVFCF
jgi:transposase InsO family protein